MSHHITDPRLIRRKSAAFAALAICCNVSGNLALSAGMHQVGPTLTVELLAYLRIIHNPLVDGGTALLALGLFANLSLLSWADLSYVLPVTAAGYSLSGLLGWAVLGEHISPGRWIGIALITAGAILVGRTQPRTTP
ncbi:MAG TPA: hypothetical protein VMB85_09585 [Bryobacteraceae bacterium]|nr:hypothetical protein [Bryobacteraceae bacterium]